MELATLQIADVRLFAGNARRGDVQMIAESLFVNGQYKPIVVNLGTHTGATLEVLAGNHTVRAAMSLGWKTIEAVIVDVDRQSALKIVAVDNRTNDVAKYDGGELVDLLRELESLDGTGYNDDTLSALIEGLDTPPDDGLPDDDDPVAPKTVVCPNCQHIFVPAK